MLRRLSAAFICAVFLAGCSQTSFLGRHVQNFTAYYNTFYNARQSFDEGIRNIERAPLTIDESRFLRVYPPAPENVGRAQFDDAIKRSADVIRNHPTSRWVDDAVLLIGKSYFYQRNYPAAIQKFREAIDLGTDLEGEARFWLARTLVANGARAEARDHITYSLDSEDLPTRWRGPLMLAYADLLVTEAEWDAAASMLAEGLDVIRDREVEPRAFFLLGQVHEMRDDADAASQAYREVARYQPPYELEFTARLHEYRTAALAGDVDGALVELRRMERDDKHRDRRSEIAYTRGVVEADAGRHDRAFEALDILLYDTDYDITPVRGRAHYELATLYRDVYEDFVLAAAHFDTAATVLPSRATAGARENLSRLAITDSREQSAIYRSYAEAYGQVTEMDSLLYLGAMSDEEFDEFVREQRQKLAEELEARRLEEERMRAQARFADGIAAQQGAMAGAQTTADAAQVGEAGFLFHRDPTRIHEGRQAFVRRWGNRPLVPGWRRQEAVDSYIVSRQQDGAGEEDGLVAIDEFDLGLPIFDVSAVPRTSAAYQRMVDNRALARYELGNVLFLSMDRPEDAARLYRQVIDENPDLPVAGRAYYALAEVHRSLDDDEEARRLYQVVLDQYPHSDLDRRIREELGLPQLAATDSAAVTRQAMNDAAEARRDGRIEDAFAGYLNLALTFPDYHTAAPALYSAAQTGLAWIRRDGLALDTPLPAGEADSLVAAAGLQWEPPVPAPADSLVGTIDLTPDDGIDVDDISGDMDGDEVDDAANTLEPDAVNSDVVNPDAVDPDVVDPGADGPDEGEPDAREIAGSEVTLDQTSVETDPDVEMAEADDAPGTGSVRVQQSREAARELPGTSEPDDAADPAGDALRVEQSIAASDTSSIAAVEPIINVGITPAEGDSRGIVLADSVVGITVDTILRHLIERYPASSVTAEAQILHDGILERLAAANAPASDSVDVDSPSLASPEDSLSAAVQHAVVDSLAQADNPFGMTGDKSIDPASGGWTIIAGSFDRAEDAEELMAGLREMHYRVSLVETSSENGALRYDVYVGQVEARNQAALALRGNSGAFPKDARVVRLSGREPSSEDR